MSRLLKNIRSRFIFAFKSIVMMSLYGLMFFGLFSAIKDKEYSLALGILSVCFVFLMIISKVNNINNFLIGGNWLNISVNKQNCETKSNPVDTEEIK